MVTEMTKTEWRALTPGTLLLVQNTQAHNRGPDPFVVEVAEGNDGRTFFDVINKEYCIVWSPKLAICCFDNNHNLHTKRDPMRQLQFTQCWLSRKHIIKVVPGTW